MPASVVYFFCPDFTSPAGGVRVLYRHVDILNTEGFRAYIVHTRPGFSSRWFVHNTPILYTQDLRLQPHDVLVIPEAYAAEMAGVRRYSPLKVWVKKRFSRNRFKYLIEELCRQPVRKVIYNQGAYLTFQNFPLPPHPFQLPYLRPDVVGTVVVSEDSWQYLQYAFPRLPVYRSYNSVDPAQFPFSSLKKKQLALITSKNPEDIRQVLHLLWVRGALEGFEVVLIRNKTQQEISRIMQESLIFLSFGSAEGFSVPPQEAMMCGCVVVGYHGRGGKEYFRPEFSYPVEAGDITGFAKQVEEVIRLHREEPQVLEEKARQAAAYIQEHYSPQREREQVARIWQELLRSPLPA